MRWSKGSLWRQGWSKRTIRTSEMIKKANYDVRDGKRAEYGIRFGQKSSLGLEILSKRGSVYIKVEKSFKKYEYSLVKSIYYSARYSIN